jgi:hypothetical protein
LNAAGCLYHFVCQRHLPLFLKAGTARNAGGFVNGPVIHADDGLRAVAPEMAGRDVFAFLVRKGFLPCHADIQAFRPQMFAEGLVHGVNLSV